MEALILLILLLVLGFVIYLIWQRWNTTNTSCGTTTTGGTSGKCFPSVNLTAKGGVIDLRHCSDDVYIMTLNKAKIHFITETGC